MTTREDREKRLRERLSYKCNKYQVRAIVNIFRRFSVELDVDEIDRLFRPAFDLPDGWVAGWVGDRIYIGVSPEGEVHS